MGYIIIIIPFFIYGIYIILRASFTMWSDMSYVKYLEDMGEFVDENGKEI